MGYTIWPDGPSGEAVESIYKERRRQEELKRQGRFKHTCADSEMTTGERLAVLGEEFGEVCHEVNEAIGGHAKLDLKELRKELVQTAAVCTAWIEHLDEAIAREAKKG